MTDIASAEFEYSQDEALVDSVRGLDWLDIFLVGVFLIGIYTGYSIQFTPTVPFPAAPSGVAGLFLLWRRRDRIEVAHVNAFVFLMLVLLASVFAAPDFNFLYKRFTGLVQMVYSLVIGYALFLTILKATRNQVAAIFFCFCAAIFVGCLLEDYGGLRSISDAAREKMYSAFIYDADLRDEMLYGQVRPKFFTSEPSAVTFGYTLFAFVWLMTSRWRWKVPTYVALMLVGILVMPGPTLLLMMLLYVPYQFLAGRAWTPTAVRMAILGILGASIVVLFFVLGSSVFSQRVNQMAEGADASTFYRIQGPALVASDVLQKYPVGGAGLTSEAFISDEVLNVYRGSSDFSPEWQFNQTFEVLTNYFWLHWIYFGLIFGVLVLAAISVWLKTLGVGGLWFCWLVWAILGQASGAYVGPKTWAVLFLAAAASILARREVGAPATDESEIDAPSGFTPPASRSFAYPSAAE
jgi:hypothetical protein